MLDSDRPRVEADDRPLATGASSSANCRSSATFRFESARDSLAQTAVSRFAAMNEPAIAGVRCARAVP